MKSASIRISGLFLVGLFFLAGCHSSPKEESQKDAPAKPPVHLASPTPINGGAHTFVPYADKPPLGTPVETH